MMINFEGYFLRGSRKLLFTDKKLNKYCRLLQLQKVAIFLNIVFLASENLSMATLFVCTPQQKSRLPPLDVIYNQCHETFV